MQATTIKLDGELLKKIRNFIPKEGSLTTFVREVLEKEIRRRKMIQAAEQYTEFLKANPEEEDFLKNWEEADLTS